MPDDAPAPVPEPPPAPSPVTLPTRPKVVITDSQKEDFYRAFLADVPYQEDFELFGGRFKVRFRAMTLRENTDLMRQVAYDKQKDRVNNDPGDYYYSRVNHYRLGLALQTVNGDLFAPGLTLEASPDDPVAGLTYVARRADMLLAWPMPKVAAVQAALAEFDDRLLAMIDAVGKPDFWKAGA
jgi:hypothetical protein